MKNPLLVFVLLFLFSDARSQNPLLKQWDYRFGGTGHDQTTVFLSTSDGGYLLGGYSASGISGNKTQPNWDTALASTDFWIVKTDAAGVMQWDRHFGGNKMDKLTAAVQSSDGGYLLGGNSNSPLSGHKSQPNWSIAGTNDFWIVKIDGQGNLLWEKSYGGTNEDQLRSVVQTTDGGYMIGGISKSGISGDKSQGTQGGMDYWIIKTDPSGNMQWDRRYGGMYDDYLFSALQCSDKGFILAGSSWSYTSGDKTQAHVGLSDYWLVKTDSSGNKLWDKVYGGTGHDDCYSMDHAANGGFILGGLSNSGISGSKTQPSWGLSDYWLVRTDDNGNMIWDKDLGGTDNEDEFNTIVTLPDGGYLLAGNSYSQAGGNKTENFLGPEQTWVIKTDSAGQVVWDKTVLLSDHIETGLAVRSADGCFAFANYTLSSPVGHKTQPSWGSVDYWMVKFCDTTTINIAPAVAAGFYSSDTIFCEKKCLSFYDISTNNPTSWYWSFPGSDSLTSQEQHPLGICYNSYGSFDVSLVACNISGCDTMLMQGFINEISPPPIPVVTISGDTLFSSPAFSYQWYLNSAGIVGATGSYYISTQPGNYHVVVTDSNGCAASSGSISTSVSDLPDMPSGPLIFPNPSNGNFHILFREPVTRAVPCVIYDVTGRRLSVILIPAGTVEFTVGMAGINPGIYFLEMNSGSTSEKRKLVISR